MTTCSKGKVELFIRYLRYSFYIPLVAQLKQADLSLDVETANIEVLKWLRDAANIRVHQTTKEQPLNRWQQETAALQPYEPAPDPVVIQDTTAVLLTPQHFEPVPLYHDLSVYDEVIQEA